MSLIRLSDAISNLRNELSLSQKKGEGKELQFLVGPIELELEVVAENESSGGAKVNWWILGGEIGTTFKGASKHKLKISLEVLSSNDTPLKVSSSTARAE